MHIRKISRELGITTQDLKVELTKINFGVNPNDTEIPDHLAAGILRVLGMKFKGTSKLKITSNTTDDEIDDEIKEKNNKKVVHEEEDEDDDKPKKKSIRERRLEEERKKQEEEIKKDKVEKEKKVQKQLEDEFRKLNRNQDQKQVNKDSGKKGQNFKGKNDKSGDGIIAITRKIQLNKEDVDNDDKKKSKKKGQQIEQDKQEQKAAKKIKFTELSSEEIEAMSDEQKIEYFAELEESKRMDNEFFKEQQQKKKKVIKTFSNQEQIKKKDGIISLPEVITIKEYGEKIGIPIPKIIVALMKNGMRMTINDSIDYDTAALLADDFKVKVKKEITSASAEELIEGDLTKLIKDEKENLITRPPVVVVMGHVDHGKTSILDYFRKSNVVSKESGGITQHIGAYQIEKNNKKITFLDTPGHEAFTKMRARGAKVTDIAILVVGADDGVKPQTIEAYNHAKEAGVSIVVAINKIDIKGVDINKVKGELADIGLIVEDWGGDVPCIGVSARNGTGMDDLLETIFLVADIKELKANPNRNAIATVIESHLDKSLGPVSTILVNTGTLKIGDVFIVGETIGKVKSMIDANGKKFKDIGPSGTAKISGFEQVPSIGDILQVVSSEKEARMRMEKIKMIYEESKKKGIGIEEIQRRIAAGKMTLLKIILKVDTEGSLEALSSSLMKIKNDEVGVKIIHSGTGSVSDSDVMMASASNAIIIGFHVSLSQQTKGLAEKEGVEIQQFEIIYDAENAIKALLSGMLKTEEVEVETGKVTVLEIFYTKKKMIIVGGKVDKGYIRKGSIVHILRKGEEIGVAEITNLKFFKDDVNEVKDGNECGMQFNKKIELEKGDILRVFVKEKKIKKLD